MNEQEFASVLKDNEKSTIEQVCAILRGHKLNIQKNLADFVAALCDVDKDAMMNVSNLRHEHLVNARRFYWCANRYMTNDTYKKIAEDTTRMGTKVTQHGVRIGVNKMLAMTEREPIWRKRWTIMKRVMRSQDDNTDEQQIPITMTIPKNVELNIKKQ